MLKFKANIVDEISREEVFHNVSLNDPNAIFVEFSSEIALNKLLKINTLSNPEKFNFFLLKLKKNILFYRISYTNHLAELVESIGIAGIKNLKNILNLYVKIKN